jgi:hypothetical protein
LLLLLLLLLPMYRDKGYHSQPANLHAISCKVDA